MHSLRLFLFMFCMMQEGIFRSAPAKKRNGRSSLSSVCRSAAIKHIGVLRRVPPRKLVAADCVYFSRSAAMMQKYRHFSTRSATRKSAAWHPMTSVERSAAMQK